ncbi:hypothetical protein NQD34_011616 [Periophthalmus magnuspinnatus]|nr:hypothetical protein NQD34_011616 [Periophthalmus magnuspinnatus]
MSLFNWKPEHRRPPSIREEYPELPLLLRDINRMELQNNILVRRRQLGNQTQYQLVLPVECRADVLSSLHDGMGHMGIDRTLDLVRTRFFWPKMANDIIVKVKTCERCIKRKALPEKAAPLINIRTSRPLELLCIDFLSLEPGLSKIKDILVMTDHFTKYAVAIPTPNQKAKTVAKTLWDHFFVHYGIPERIHSDQGPDFESRTMKELCDMAGILKVHTTPYHPRGNPVERFNRTLLNMLGTLSAENKSHWKDFVKPLVHAYNCTRNDTTGFSPYELMFGRQPRLPIDLAFGLPVKEPAQTHSEYVQKLRENLEKSYRLATENAEKVMSRNKSRFDKHVTPSQLEVGDRVLVRNVKLRGKHKIADKWESDVYVVVKRAEELPVYTIRPEHKSKPLRTLHRDLLLPCGYLSVDSKRKVKPASIVKPPQIASTDSTSHDDDSDFVPDDFVPSYWYNPIPEPVRFTTTVDIAPASVEPVCADSPQKSPPIQSNEPPLNPSDSTDIEVESLAEDLGLTQRSDSSEVNLATNLPAPIVDIPVTNVTPHSEPGEEGLNELDHSPSGSSDSDSPISFEQPSGRPTRTRKPPDRLHYSKLGTPWMKSLQAIFHGLSTAFSYELEDAEVTVGAASSPSAVCSQPGQCTRTYIESGGDPVTPSI